MKKIITVFGTRPDAIKMAPVVLELKKHPTDFDLRIVVTGQHREMLDQVLSVFKIVPDYDLKIMTPGQTLSEITTRSLIGLDPIFLSERPDIVVAQGDTTTTFVAALAAFYHKADFGHVEAGLRTGDRFNPYPEETNRLLTTRLASLHFAPTHEAKENLLAEGVPPDSVFLTGNTVIDALLATAQSNCEIIDPALSKILSLNAPVLLVTAHRRENWGDPLRQICLAVSRILEQFTNVHVAFPMHRNPIVREIAREILGGVDRAHLIEPPDYAPFVKLLQKCYFVLTDSGGVQEEAPSLGKPVLVLRETTERPEGIAAGTAKLVGTNSGLIFDETARLLTDTSYYTSMAHATSPYGDGSAAIKIVQALNKNIRSA
jgi:UDP-N-acetylglucosamine 2-epimerase (non-hydrolysing)